MKLPVGTSNSRVGHGCRAIIVSATIVLQLLLAGCVESVVPGYKDTIVERDDLRTTSVDLHERLNVTEAHLTKERQNVSDERARVAELAAALDDIVDSRDAYRTELEAMTVDRNHQRALVTIAQSVTAKKEAEISQLTEEINDKGAQIIRLNENLSVARSERNESRASESEQVRTLRGQLWTASENYKEIQSKYNAALADEFTTITTIEAGNVSWHFTDLRAETQSWTYSIDSYRQYVLVPRSTSTLRLQTNSGKTITVPDPRPYVTPSFFQNVISDLTDERSATSFVREVFNMKKQLVVYNFSLVDDKGYYEYPAETMTDGTGICGDTTILLASLLIAGNDKAHYGMKVSIWIVDLDSTTGTIRTNPESINHALIEVVYADGTKEWIETTSRNFYTYNEISGWRYELPDDGNFNK